MKKLTKLVLAVIGVSIITVTAVIYNNHNQFDGQIINPQQAFEQTKNNQIILVDIRRPDEWKNTGIPKGAMPIDMRDKNFVAKIKKLYQTHNKPIALICAHGVRSKRLAKKIKEININVIDVPEGMLGSNHGPGWIKRKLPIKQLAQKTQS